MNRKIGLAVALAALVGAQGCHLFDQKITMTLDPDQVLTIETDPDSTVGVTKDPITISPADAGNAYTNNKDRFTDATLKTMDFEIVGVYPDNRATKLLDTSVTLVDTVTGKSAVFFIAAPMDLKLGDVYTITAFSPDPSPFLMEILQSGDTFTASAVSNIDQAPVHIDLRIHLSVTLTVAVF